jgi:hypothetical protein
MHVKVPYHDCIYNSLSEDESSSSKHVEDITKLKIVILRKSALRWFISYNYIIMHGAKKKTHKKYSHFLPLNENYKLRS